jgi:hypothetical protein
MDYLKNPYVLSAAAAVVVYFLGNQSPGPDIDVGNNASLWMIKFAVGNENSKDNLGEVMQTQLNRVPIYLAVLTFLVVYFGASAVSDFM